MKKLKMTTQKLTFSEGCNKYLENCRQRNLREGMQGKPFRRKAFPPFLRPFCTAKPARGGRRLRAPILPPKSLK